MELMDKNDKNDNKHCEICEIEATCLCFDCINYYCDDCFKYVHEKKAKSNQ